MPETVQIQRMNEQLNELLGPKPKSMEELYSELIEEGYTPDQAADLVYLNNTGEELNKNN